MASGERTFEELGDVGLLANVHDEAVVAVDGEEIGVVIEKRAGRWRADGQWSRHISGSGRTGSASKVHGRKERRPPVHVLLLDIGTVLDQHVYRGDIVHHGGAMKRAHAEQIVHVGVAIATQEELDIGGIAAARRLEKKNVRVKVRELDVVRGIGVQHGAFARVGIPGKSGQGVGKTLERRVEMGGDNDKNGTNTKRHHMKIKRTSSRLSPSTASAALRAFARHSPAPRHPVSTLSSENPTTDLT